MPWSHISRKFFSIWHIAKHKAQSCENVQLKRPPIWWWSGAIMSELTATSKTVFIKMMFTICLFMSLSCSKTALVKCVKSAPLSGADVRIWIFEKLHANYCSTLAWFLTALIDWHRWHVITNSKRTCNELHTHSVEIKRPWLHARVCLRVFVAEVWSDRARTMEGCYADKKWLQERERVQRLYHWLLVL